MAWIITVDHIEDGARVETFGPRTTELARDEIIDHVDATPFRMFDDDGILYYEGLMTTPDTDPFAPLDHFGAPNAGCTMIELKTDGGWERV